MSSNGIQEVIEDGHPNTASTLGHVLNHFPNTGLKQIEKQAGVKKIDHILSTLDRTVIKMSISVC